MNTIAVLITAGLVIGAVVSGLGLLQSSGSTIRFISGAIVTVLLLALAGFCVFGFLASSEPPAAAHEPWKIGYAIIGLGALSGSALTARRTLRKS